MEMANNEAGNMPKSYSLNMFKDFVPMTIFSEVNQGQHFATWFVKLCYGRVISHILNVVILLSCWLNCK